MPGRGLPGLGLLGLLLLLAVLLLLPLPLLLLSVLLLLLLVAVLGAARLVTSLLHPSMVHLTLATPLRHTACHLKNTHTTYTSFMRSHDMYNEQIMKLKLISEMKLSTKSFTIGWYFCTVSGYVLPLLLNITMKLIVLYRIFLHIMMQ